MKRVLTTNKAIRDFPRVAWRLLLVLVFLLLAGGTVALFALNLTESLSKSVWFCAFAIMLLVGLVAETALEWRNWSRRETRENTFTAGDLYDFFAVLAGAAVTFVLSVDLGLGAVTASALAGLIASVFLKRYAVAVFCGSFVGMASPDIYRLWPCMVFAGSIAGLVFVAGKRFFNGFGGKLGTTAMIGCLSVIFFSPRPLLAIETPGWNVGVWILAYSIIGAVATFMLNVRFSRGPVQASAIAGLAAGLLLPRLHGAAMGSTYAAAVFCASFAGMCSTERIAEEHWMAVAGLICGLAFVQTTPYFAGAGGKLGTLAFGSVISLHGILRIGKGLRQGFSARRRKRRHAATDVETP